MHVLVNGVRLFFDVEAERLYHMCCHAGKADLADASRRPRSDHSIYRPAYSALADIAQIVYLDHRGNGRSEDGPQEGWNLAQWATMCAPLRGARHRRSLRAGRFVRGMVALAYATRHPAHPSRLILISTKPPAAPIWSGG